jgi:hypothetical protein
MIKSSLAERFCQQLSLFPVDEADCLGLGEQSPFAPVLWILTLGSHPKGLRSRIGSIISDYLWASQIIPMPSPSTNSFSSAAGDGRDGLGVNLEYSALPKSHAKL